MLYLNRTKEEIRQRKMMNQLTNTKSIRKEQLDLNKLEHVLMSQMKAQDKKKFLQSFFADP
jgi:hypothetical protein